MKKSKKIIRNFKSLKYALTATLALFICLSMNAQEKLNNPLDNADKGLIYTQEQQDKLTQELTEFWTNKLTSEKTAEWNNKLTNKLTTAWNEKLTSKLTKENEAKLTSKLKEKWDPILNEKYPNSEKYYRQ
mgnify:CR=1 FL=1